MMRQYRIITFNIFTITLNTLMLEMLLIRIFDVIFIPNVAYAIITCAMYAYAISGVIGMIFPVKNECHLMKKLMSLTALMAISVFLIRPALNLSSHIFQVASNAIIKYLFVGSLLYMTILIPFLISSLIVIYIFSHFKMKTAKLYFWDLFGAAIGSVIFLPFLRKLGPGLLIILSSLSLSLCYAALSDKKLVRNLIYLGVILSLAILWSWSPKLDFQIIVDKRGVGTAMRSGKIEFSEWDPISKIDIIDQNSYTEDSDEIIIRAKHIAYDGGSQSSHFFPFDGDLEKLRDDILCDDKYIKKHFWNKGVIASHYLKRDGQTEALIFGSAGGQEIKAGLLFNPKSLQGVELVETIVRLGKTAYADFTGNIYLDPRVNDQVDEARNFLRKSDKKYDIIQIFSNHQSSNIASGMSATGTVYLHTIEAYTEYFNHLKNDGILHVNHHFYPRIVTTAAAAWKSTGKGNFQSNCLVIEKRKQFDTLPTILIKMKAWEKPEVDQVKSLFKIEGTAIDDYEMVVNPIDSEKSFLSPEFFSGSLSSEFVSSLDYFIEPCTDDRPFFDNIQKHFKLVEENPKKFLDVSMTGALNGRLRWPVGEYTTYIAVIVAGLFFFIFLIVLPLYYAKLNDVSWPSKFTILSYFSCLGIGFITVELILVQIYMKLFGYPLCVYSIVIFTILISAAIGSYYSEKLSKSNKFWLIPFSGIIVTGLLNLAAHVWMIDILLGLPFFIRIIAAIAIIFPTGFFLGMPFPLGISMLKQVPDGAIAWSWGVNGLFTVLGGAVSGIVSILFGFRITLLFGLIVYAFAYMLFHKMKLAFQID